MFQPTPFTREQTPNQMENITDILNTVTRYTFKFLREELLTTN
jgi:hypothetical protein